MIRKRTFWFVVDRGRIHRTNLLRHDPYKHTIFSRTMRGIWGEWWS